MRDFFSSSSLRLALFCICFVLIATRHGSATPTPPVSEGLGEEAIHVFTNPEPEESSLQSILQPIDAHFNGYTHHENYHWHHSLPSRVPDENLHASQASSSTETGPEVGSHQPILEQSPDEAHSSTETWEGSVPDEVLRRNHRIQFQLAQQRYVQQMQQIQQQELIRKQQQIIRQQRAQAMRHQLLQLHALDRAAGHSASTSNAAYRSNVVSEGEPYRNPHLYPSTTNPVASFHGAHGSLNYHPPLNPELHHPAFRDGNPQASPSTAFQGNPPGSSTLKRALEEVVGKVERFPEFSDPIVLEDWSRIMRDTIMAQQDNKPWDLLKAVRSSESARYRLFKFRMPPESIYLEKLYGGAPSWEGKQARGRVQSLLAPIYDPNNEAKFTQKVRLAKDHNELVNKITKLRFPNQLIDLGGRVKGKDPGIRKWLMLRPLFGIRTEDGITMQREGYLMADPMALKTFFPALPGPIKDQLKDGEVALIHFRRFDPDSRNKHSLPQELHRLHGIMNLEFLDPASWSGGSRESQPK